MTRRFRTLLLCFMIAALPLQGLAAVLKLACTPAHRMSMTMVHADAHERHQAGLHVHPAHHDVDKAAQADDSAPPAVNAYCSACAACWIGAGAPPPAEPAMAFHADRQPVAVTAAQGLSGDIPYRLERPPRQFSS